MGKRVKGGFPIYANLLSKACFKNKLLKLSKGSMYGLQIRTPGKFSSNQLIPWTCLFAELFPCISPLSIFLLHKASLHIKMRSFHIPFPGEKHFSHFYLNSLPSTRHLGKSPPSQTLCFKEENEKLHLKKDSTWGTSVFKAWFCWTGQFFWSSAHFHLNILREL